MPPDTNKSCHIIIYDSFKIKNYSLSEATSSIFTSATSAPSSSESRRAFMKPEFRFDIKDKYSYFLLTEDFINSKQMVLSYVKHITDHLFNL